MLINVMLIKKTYIIVKN